MCCLFGLIDYKGSLSYFQKNHIIKILSKSAMARGTDATGIAYNSNGKMVIYKNPMPANRMQFHIPRDANFIIGHTRLTTQGNEKFNYNNHPFLSNANEMVFALAHNGIIYNDRELRKSEKLPDTKIETDSYIAIQLLEKERTLDFEAIKHMAEKIQGSFCFNILDVENNLYFVKGDNPMCIYHFVKKGFYLYASTQEILKQAVKKLRLTIETHNSIEISMGDILKIDSKGNITSAKFDTTNINSSRFNWLNDYQSGYSLSYSKMLSKSDTFLIESQIELLLDMAESIGIGEDEIYLLLEYGFSLTEVVEMLENPKYIRNSIQYIFCELIKE